MGVPENVDALLVKYDITQETLARIAGVTPGAVTGWRKGAKPRDESIRNICAHFGMSEDDLLSDQYGLAAKEHGTFKGAFVTPVSYAVVGSVEVPVLGKVHAGEPLDHDEACDTVHIPDFVVARDPDVFVIHSEGDCVNKLFGENDDFAVSPNTKPKNGSVVVAKLMRADEEEYIIRQYFRTAQTLILSPCSYNPEHKDIIITADSDMSAEISGVIIWNQARRLMD